MSDHITALTGAPAYPVLRAEDLARATRFYRDSLGLDVREIPGHPNEVRVFAGSGTLLCLYARPGMQAPQNTVACFEVPDLDSAVTDLKGRGVHFEDYDMPDMGLVTHGGIAVIGDERRAWFSDTEGNAIVLRETRTGDANV